VAAIEIALERYRRPGILAIVLIGSLARGDERPDSDVDLYLVATADGFAERSPSERRGFWDAETVDGIPGYDVKVATIDHLRDAVVRASDETRACLDDARVLWAVDPSTADDVSRLIERINRPGDGYWSEHRASFLARAAIDCHFLVEGLALGNRVMVASGSAHLVVSLGRVVLAHNRILYRGPKYLERQLALADATPPDFAARLLALLDRPTAADAGALFGETWTLVGDAVPGDTLLTRYFEENELAWLTGVIPPEYR
jgi:predicted nucleotidyltransferase